VNAVKIVVDDVIGKVPALSDQLVAALVDEAHRNGLRIVAHVSVKDDVSTTKRLVELGLDESTLRRRRRETGRWNRLDQRAEQVGRPEPSARRLHTSRNG
jgi:hypothetical protein